MDASHVPVPEPGASRTGSTATYAGAPTVQFAAALHVKRDLTTCSMADQGTTVVPVDSKDEIRSGRRIEALNVFVGRLGPATAIASVVSELKRTPTKAIECTVFMRSIFII